MSTIMITIGKLNPGGQAHLERYAEIVIPLLKAKSVNIRGRYRGVEALLGDDYPDLVAIMEFHNLEGMNDFLASPEYALALPHRQKAFQVIQTFACEAIS